MKTSRYRCNAPQNAHLSVRRTPIGARSQNCCLHNIIAQLFLRLLFVARAICANGSAEVALEYPLLEINRASPTSAIFDLTPPKEDTLAELPALNTNEEEEGCHEDNAPLPADALVPENRVIDDGNVEDGEDCNETEHDGEEQELVPPDVACPLREVLCRSRLHHEERAAHVQHLPCKEQREPGKTSECSRTSAEHSVASGVIRFVTRLAEVAIAEAEHDEREGRETKSGDPKTIEEHVDHDFDCENTTLELYRISKLCE
jgi:hypothetical protein